MQYDRFLHSYPVEWYTEAGFDYLITSSYIANLGFVSEEQNTQKEAFYEEMEAELRLVKAFSPYRQGVEPSWIYEETYGPATHLWQYRCPGPTLRIFQLP
jgi:hypothetical protein